MPIVPLPQFEADLLADREEQEAIARLKPPTSMVVRFGAMRQIGEYPYDGDATPGCGSKIVARTHRGVELTTLLTSTCPNAGCGHSVTRQEMLEYIENSGGRDYPFHENGRVIRVATGRDLDKQARFDAEAPDLRKNAQSEADVLGLEMRFVEAERLLSGERVVLYFTAEERVDFRELAQALSRRFKARIDLRQVGARDEARLVADYERCGQHCCCKQFLKVLKPVSMRSAKVQKATLDPLKISGRCGRLMCCLRYEDQTYAELKKRLPKKKTQVVTPDGPGIVIDTQILTQIVLVRLDGAPRNVAFPLEELEGHDGADPVRASVKAAMKKGKRDESEVLDAWRKQRGKKKAESQDEAKPHAERTTTESPDTSDTPASPTKKRRRRRRKPAQAEGQRPASDRAPAQPSDPRPEKGAPPRDADAPGQQQGVAGEKSDQPRKRRRRRRRKPPGGAPGDRAAGPGSPPEAPPS